MGKTAEGLCTDIDQRLRCIQQELDRVAHSSNPEINSSVLHSAPQRYPTSTLRLELDAQIDRLLREQVSACVFPVKGVVDNMVLPLHLKYFVRDACRVMRVVWPTYCRCNNESGRIFI